MKNGKFPILAFLKFQLAVVVLLVQLKNKQFKDYFVNMTLPKVI